MPVNTDEIINACNLLAEQKNLTVAITESAKAASAIGLCAFVGGLLGGPVGIGVGGVVGSLAAATKCQGKFKSVLYIIQYEMTPMQKARLAVTLSNAFKEVGVEEVAFVASMVLDKGVIQDIAVREIARFLQSEMGYSLAR